MPPRTLPRLMARTVAVKETADLVSTEEFTTLKSHSQINTEGAALPIIVIAVVGILLILAILLMPEDIFSNLTVRIGTWRRNVTNHMQFWPGWKAKVKEASVAEKTELTFVQQHLEMLRCWRKPTALVQLQGRPDATSFSSTSYRSRQEMGCSFPQPC